MVTSSPHRAQRSAGWTVCSLHLIRLAVLALLVGVALAAVALSRAVPGTATDVVEVVVVAYAVLSGVPMWIVMGRLIGSATGRADPDVESAAPLAPVIPLHTFRPRAS